MPNDDPTELLFVLSHAVERLPLGDIAFRLDCSSIADRDSPAPSSSAAYVMELSAALKFAEDLLRAARQTDA